MYKDFDLPTNYQAIGADYIPPRARDEAEIERRHQLPSGTILAEQQCDGVAIATDILRQITNPSDARFASRLIGASALNTSWYLFAQSAPVMRRRLKLPVLATFDPKARPFSCELALQRDQALGAAAHEASTYKNTVSTWSYPNTLERQRTTLGRKIGNLSLLIATVDLGDSISRNRVELSDFRLQDIVRERGQRTLSDARELGADLHTIPSLAQLANPDSDLSVFWRRNAPNGALQAYETAYEQFAA